MNIQLESDRKTKMPARLVLQSGDPEEIGTDLSIFSELLIDNDTEITTPLLEE